MARMILILAAKGCPTAEITVASFAEASRTWSRYRDRNGFGGSSLTPRSGALIDEDGRRYQVSYNGKVWPSRRWVPDMKPLYDPYQEK